MNNTQNLTLRYVEDTDSVRGLVWRRKGALIYVRPGDRRSAQCHIYGLVVGAWMNTSRPLAEWDGGNHFIGAGADHGQISRDLIGYIKPKR